MAYLSSATKVFTAQGRWKDGVDIETMTGAATWTKTTGNIQILDPGGADRAVTLPAEEDSNGLWFAVRNVADADEVISISNDGASLVVALGRGDSAVLACDGSGWGAVEVVREQHVADLGELAGNLTLDAYGPKVLRIDAGGSARDIILPAEALSTGMTFAVYNYGGENLVFKDDGGSTILTLTPAGYSVLGCNGTAWLPYTPILAA